MCSQVTELSDVPCSSVKTYNFMTLNYDNHHELLSKMTINTWGVQKTPLHHKDRRSWVFILFGIVNKTVKFQTAAYMSLLLELHFNVHFWDKISLS